MSSQLIKVVGLVSGNGCGLLPRGLLVAVSSRRDDAMASWQKGQDSKESPYQAPLAFLLTHRWFLNGSNLMPPQ